MLARSLGATLTTHLNLVSSLRIGGALPTLSHVDIFVNCNWVDTRWQ